MTWITESEFAELAQRDPYYRGRWGYTSAAIALAKASLFRSGFLEPSVPCVIEVGPGLRPLFQHSTVLDVKGAPHFPPHDVGIAPWPTTNAECGVGKPYDLVMGLQVWEHLGSHDPGEKQQIAFREALRLAWNIILSFPLGWDCPEDPTHHGITREKIRRWTLDVEPTAEVVVSKRLICLWRF